MEEAAARRRWGAGESGMVWRRWRRPSEASAAAKARGSAAVLGASAIGAGEEEDFGEVVWAAQATKSLGKRPRS